jgi:hypothetical protein
MSAWGEIEPPQMVKSGKIVAYRRLRFLRLAAPNFHG